MKILSIPSFNQDPFTIMSISWDELNPETTFR